MPRQPVVGENGPLPGTQCPGVSKDCQEQPQQLDEENSLVRQYTTLCQDNGEEIVVGEFSLPSVPNPQELWPMSSTPYVFLSHTGQDGTKKEIARPTYWFLTEILHVDTFLDEEDCLRGVSKVEALMKPAYKCTHAVLILSPLYRTREYCVREMNTFMGRLRRQDGIRVLPALYNMKYLDGYHQEVDDIIWFVNPNTTYSVDYMIKFLWPALVKEFKKPNKTMDEYERYFCRYVVEHRSGRHEIPPEHQTFVERKRHIKKQNRWRLWCLFILCLVVIAAAVIAVVLLTKDPPPPTMMPSGVPSGSPSAFPTIMNDGCEKAVALTLGETQRVSTTGASYQVISPCKSNGDNGNEAIPGVWYSLNGTGDVLEITTCGLDFDPLNFISSDSIITVFSGSCGNLSCVDSNDDDFIGLCDSLSRVQWNSTEGNLYFILVHNRKEDSGWFSLRTRVLNDSCENSVGPLTIGQLETGSTLLARSDNISACGDVIASNSPGVWYSVKGTGDRLWATTCTAFHGMNKEFDSHMTILSGNCGNLSCVDFNDDEDKECGAEAGVVWNSVLDEIYYIFIRGYYDDEPGTFGLEIRYPLNDRCYHAIGPLSSGDNVQGSTVGARFSCVTKCGLATETESPGLWYTTIGTGGGIEVKTCTDGFFAQITIMTGSCEENQCVAGWRTFLVCQRLSWASRQGELYYILIHGFRAQTGSFDLALRNYTNDQCRTALGPLERDAPVEGSIVGLSNQNAVPACGEVLATNATGLWFTVLGSDQFLEAKACHDSSGSFFMRLTVWKGVCDSLECVDGKEITTPCGEISWPSIGNELYYVFVHGVVDANYSGTFDLEITVPPFSLGM